MEGGKPVVIANAEGADNSVVGFSKKESASSDKWRDAKSSSTRKIPSTRSRPLVVTMLNSSEAKRYLPGEAGNIMQSASE